MTVEAMEVEARALPLPASLHALSVALLESDSVFFHHRHSLSEDVDVVNKSASLSSRFLSLRLDSLYCHESRQEWEEEWKRRRETDLRRALTTLTNSVGSIDKILSDWSQCLEALSAVVSLPHEPTTTTSLSSSGRQSSKTRPHKKGQLRRRTALDIYRDKITKAAQSRGILSNNAKWAQISATTVPRRDPSVGAQNTPLSLDDEPHVDTNLEKMDRLLANRTTEAERRSKSHQRQEKLRIQRDIEKREQELARREDDAARQAASFLLRPLSVEEQTIVRNAIYGIGNPLDVIAQTGTDVVQRQSMRKLQPGQWLNDEVIHYFLLMLARRDEELCQSSTTTKPRKRSHFFKSFFVTKLFDEGATNQYKYSNVKKWSRRVPGGDIFNLRQVICPINVGNVHWTCAVIFVEETRIQFYDSMGGNGTFYLKGLLRYLGDEWDRMGKGGTFNKNGEWKLMECTKDTPRQENSFDCGVFTCMFADFVSKDCSLTFSQEHVTQCRERIALSIMKGIAIH